MSRDVMEQPGSPSSCTHLRVNKSRVRLQGAQARSDVVRLKVPTANFNVNVTAEACWRDIERLQIIVWLRLHLTQLAH